MIKKENKNVFYLVVGFFLLISLFFASIHLFRGDVLFHTDLARDLLIVEEIVNTRRPDLIGPRAGGIPGLFFGPIWYYAMIPFFLIGGGSPIAIGVFWLLMVILAVVSSGFVADRVFGRKVAMLTLVLYPFYLSQLAKGFTQSFGSLILSPLILYLIYLFYLKKEKKQIVLIFILLGILYHLQPAFGMISILLTTLIILNKLIRIKKIRYVFILLLIIIPLSNFILFDFRHDFLQIRSFSNFLINPPEARSALSAESLVVNRLENMISRLNLFTWNTMPFYMITIGLNIYIAVKAYLDKKLKSRSFYMMFFVFYILFWIVSLFFKGTVWDFYHWGFLPLVIIVFISSYKLLNKKIFFIVYVFLLVSSIYINIKDISYWRNEFSGRDSSSWKLNNNIADYLFDKSGKSDFGYFVYSPDEFGYPVKYALNYSNKFYINIPEICSKKPITYLIYYPTPEIGAVTDPRYWKEQKVNIVKKPVSSKKFGEILVEEYRLNEDEIKIQSDSSLICDLVLR